MSTISIKYMRLSAWFLKQACVLTDFLPSNQLLRIWSLECMVICCQLSVEELVLMSMWYLADKGCLACIGSHQEYLAGKDWIGRARGFYPNGSIGKTRYRTSEAFPLKDLLGKTRYLRVCSGILLRKPEYLASKDVHVSYRGRHRNPYVVCFSDSLRRRTRLLISELSFLPYAS